MKKNKTQPIKIGSKKTSFYLKEIDSINDLKAS